MLSIGIMTTTASQNQPKVSARMRRRPQPTSRFGRWFLAQEKRPDGLSAVEIADRLGKTRSYVNMLRTGAHSAPSLEIAVAIEKLSGGAVPTNSWLKKPRLRTR